MKVQEVSGKSCRKKVRGERKFIRGGRHVRSLPYCMYQIEINTESNVRPSSRGVHLVHPIIDHLL